MRLSQSLPAVVTLMAVLTLLPLRLLRLLLLLTALAASVGCPRQRGTAAHAAGARKAEMEWKKHLPSAGTGIATYIDRHSN